MKEQKVEFGNVKTKSVVITIKDFYPGSKYQDTTISEVKFVIKKND
jgi:hypothetical protein